jgi:hypothetical protein
MLFKCRSICSNGLASGNNFVATLARLQLPQRRQSDDPSQVSAGPAGCLHPQRRVKDGHLGWLGRYMWLYCCFDDFFQ